MENAILYVAFAILIWQLLVQLYAGCHAVLLYVLPYRMLMYSKQNE